MTELLAIIFLLILSFHGGSVLEHLQIGHIGHQARQVLHGDQEVGFLAHHLRDGREVRLTRLGRPGVLGVEDFEEHLLVMARGTVRRREVLSQHLVLRLHVRNLSLHLFNRLRKFFRHLARFHLL